MGRGQDQSAVPGSGWLSLLRFLVQTPCLVCSRCLCDGVGTQRNTEAQNTGPGLSGAGRAGRCRTPCHSRALSEAATLSGPHFLIHGTEIVTTAR